MAIPNCLSAAASDAPLVALLDEARALQAAGDAAAALKQLGMAMKQWPRDYRVAQALSTLYEQTGQVTLANRFRQLANKHRGGRQ